MIEIFSEQLLVEYVKPTDKNPNGIGKLTVIGLVFVPPTSYREFEHVVEIKDVQPFAEIIFNVTASIIAEIRKKKATVQTVVVNVTAFAFTYEEKKITAADGVTLFEPNILAAKAAGAFQLPGAQPIPFEASILPDLLPKFEAALLPIKETVIQQVQVLNDQPHFVPPIAIRENPADVVSLPLASGKMDETPAAPTASTDAQETADESEVIE